MFGGQIATRTPAGVWARLSATFTASTIWSDRPFIFQFPATSLRTVAIAPQLILRPVVPPGGSNGYAKPRHLSTGVACPEGRSLADQPPFRGIRP